MTGVGDKHDLLRLCVERNQPFTDLVIQYVVIIEPRQALGPRTVRDPGLVIVPDGLVVIFILCR